MGDIMTIVRRYLVTWIDQGKPRDEALMEKPHTPILVVQKGREVPRERPSPAPNACAPS